MYDPNNWKTNDELLRMQPATNFEELLQERLRSAVEGIEHKERHIRVLQQDIGEMANL